MSKGSLHLINTAQGYVLKVEKKKKLFYHSFSYEKMCFQRGFS